ncbi:MAG: FAD-binding oxidoreductase [Raineya sp.]|jgi:glycine/D-amino acid oxidase-like deaminating enzyme|nr:FAD-binding oxidoreductase [Raineya sp.]
MLSFWEKESFVKYDYIIVGSGIVGLSTAATLIEKFPHKKILILERGIFPLGASTKNAGFACFGNPTELLWDIDYVGEEAMLELVNKRWQGLMALRTRLSDKKTGFKQTGSHEIILDIPDDFENKIKQLNKLLKKVFEKDVFAITKSHKIKEFGFNYSLAKMLVSNIFEGQLHTGMLITNLLAYLQKKGVKILNGCTVNQFKDFKSGVEVLVNNEISFQATKVAICTNAFINQFFSHLSVKPGRGQVLVTKPIKNLKIKGNFHFDEGFYYFRDVGKGQILFGGGRNLDFEGETTTEINTTEKIINNLKDKLSTLILPTHNFEIEQTWAGIMAYTPNRKPIVELCSSNIVLGVALNGMGVAIGTNIGEQTAQLII